MIRFVAVEKIITVDVIADETVDAYLEAAQRLVDATLHHHSVGAEDLEVLAPVAAAVTAARVEMQAEWRGRRRPNRCPGN